MHDGFICNHTENSENNSKRVNAAVKIKLQIEKNAKKSLELTKDLFRLKKGMSNVELNEYTKRIR
jgi:hypothetical protein